MYAIQYRLKGSSEKWVDSAYFITDSDAQLFSEAFEGMYDDQETSMCEIEAHEILGE